MQKIWSLVVKCFTYLRHYFPHINLTIWTDLQPPRLDFISYFCQIFAMKLNIYRIIDLLLLVTLYMNGPGDSVNHICIRSDRSCGTFKAWPQIASKEIFLRNLFTPTSQYRIVKTWFFLLAMFSGCWCRTTVSTKVC